MLSDDIVLDSYMQASDHNNAGEYEDARRCGQMALACNVCTIVKYAVAVVVLIILLIVYFTAGFGCSVRCDYDIYGERVCTCV